MARRTQAEVVPALLWTTTTQFVCTLARGDERIAVAVQPHLDKWQALALVTRDGAGVEEVLDNHAHKVIGLYDSPASALAAAEGFAIAWFKKFKATNAKACACAELG